MQGKIVFRYIGLLLLEKRGFRFKNGKKCAFRLPNIERNVFLEVQVPIYRKKEAMDFKMQKKRCFSKFRFLNLKKTEDLDFNMKKKTCL